MHGQYFNPLQSSLLMLIFCFAQALHPGHASEQSDQKKCLYVSSYHTGYEWSDEIEASIRETLAGHCELRQVDMDTKRNKNPEEIFNVVNSIIKQIEDWQPDVVITSDDSAAKFLIEPHYKDDKVPFVFSGVNWTVEEYGFPYKNVTGIVEVAPIRTLLREAVTISNHGRKAIFIGPDSLSEKKNFNRLKLAAEEFNIQIKPLYYASFSQWKKALEIIDLYDFAVFGSNEGIDAWDAEEAERAALQFTTKPTFTTDSWMMPYTVFGFTKLASEQGQWAATVAINILDGASPADIPLASNKKWEFWVNEAILPGLKSPPGRSLLRKAKRLNATAIHE